MHHSHRIAVLALFAVFILLAGCISVEDVPVSCNVTNSSSAQNTTSNPDSSSVNKSSSEVPPGPIGGSSDPKSTGDGSSTPTAKDPSVSTPASGAASSSTPASSTPSGAPSSASPPSSSTKPVRDPALKTSAGAATPSPNSLPTEPPADSITTRAILRPPTGPIKEPEVINQPPSSPVQPIVKKGLDGEEIYVFPVKRVKEGGLVSFDGLNATDPDGDVVTYFFEAPLDEKGHWLTKRGDAGRYYTNITASDGKNVTVQTVIIYVEPINKAPFMDRIKPITVNEGEVIRLSPIVTDPDGDKPKVTISGWKTKFPYTTTFDDGGQHTVIVTADDGFAQTTQDVSITVKEVNRAPVIKSLPNITVEGGDRVTVKPTAVDADGDPITFTFSRPVDAEGKWDTTSGDAGSYPITVTASDGKSSNRTSFTITVIKPNLPPVLSGVKNLAAREGETVQAIIAAVDPEGQNVTIRYSGFMDGPTKTVTFEDSGSHEVIVTASDGVTKSTARFTVTVGDVNRPPVFLPESFK